MPFLYLSKLGGLLNWIPAILNAAMKQLKRYKTSCVGNICLLSTKMLLSVITKNLNCETLNKNLVNFKRWDGFNDEKF